MYAIVFKLIVAGHVFFVPGHSRFQYGEQCKAALPRAMKRVVPRDNNARLVSAGCKIMESEVRI